ncbi:MAG: nitrous oxide reductase family maturation protein NosD [Candidatus Binatia bacterium]
MYLVRQFHLCGVVLLVLVLQTVCGPLAAHAQSSSCLLENPQHVRRAVGAACRAYGRAAHRGTALDLSRAARIPLGTACRADTEQVCAELATLCYGNAFDPVAGGFPTKVSDHCAVATGRSCTAALRGEMRSPGRGAARLARIERRCEDPITGMLGGVCADVTTTAAAQVCLAAEIARLASRVIPLAPMPSNGRTWVPHRGGTVCKGALARPAPGTDVWVSPDGNDADPGTADAPLRTLARALCNAAPGQTVHVGLGTYAESVLLSEFGQAESPIRIVGEVGPQGALPVLDGGRTLTVGIGIIGEDTAHKSAGFEIENLEVKNYTDEGLLAVIATNVTVRGCRVHDNGFHSIDRDQDGEGFGVSIVDMEGVTVEGVESYANGPDVGRQAKGILGTGVDIFGSTHITVRDCNLHDNIGGGLLVEDCTDALVETNTIHANQLDANGDYWDGGIWVDGGRDVTVRNNTITGNLGPGIEVSDEGVQHPTGYVVEGNRLDGNFWGMYVWNFGVCPWPSAEILERSGNTFANNARGDAMCSKWECGVGKPCD